VASVGHRFLVLPVASGIRDGLEGPYRFFLPTTFMLVPTFSYVTSYLPDPNASYYYHYEGYDQRNAGQRSAGNLEGADIDVAIGSLEVDDLLPRMRGVENETEAQKWDGEGKDERE
jgi:hypothetical protein